MTKAPYPSTVRFFGLATALAVFAACGETPTSPPPLDLGLDGSLVGVHKHKGKIVFASSRDGNSEIYVMNADGSGLKNLTNHPANDTEPSWSRNGRKIVFTSNRRIPDAAFFMQDVWIMNADGSHLRRVTTTTAADLWPDLSPNGKHILFTRTHEPPPLPGVVPQNFVIDVDGTGETNLTNNVGPSCFPPVSEDCSFENQPKWSPNGKKILFNQTFDPGDFDLFVMNPDGSGRTNITNSPGRNDFFASWSPDGRKIVFTSGPARSPELDIYIMKADGSHVRQLTFDGSAGIDLGAVWSPDSRKIAFFSLRGGPPSIYTINRDGTNEMLLNTGPDAAWPSWARGHVRHHHDIDPD